MAGAAPRGLGLSAEGVAAVVGGTLTVAGAAPTAPLGRVATDTRRLPPGDPVYLALRGPNFDGHDFVAAAVAAGARCVVSQRAASELGPVGDAAVIEVDDTLAALQRLASWWRGRLRGLVVGITGSNGKTAVKEWAHGILHGVVPVYRSPGSFNSQVGVALSLLEAPVDAAISLIECGVSQRGEMALLREMVRPDAGVFTHLGRAHLAGLGSEAGIAAEKLALFEGMTGVLVAHESVGAHLESWRPGAGGRLVVVGRGDAAGHRTGRAAATCSIEGLERGRDGGWQFSLRCGEELAPFGIPALPEHEVENAACAIALAIHLPPHLRPPLGAVAAGLRHYRPAPMRLEMHTSTSGSGITLLNDSYTADPVSAASALATLSRTARGRRALAVLGGMAELGEASDALHRELGARAVAAGVARLVVVGTNAEAIAAGAEAAGMAPERIARVADVDEAARVLDDELRFGDVVLVKASRPERLERTAEHLLEGMSATRAYIDLEAIAENVRQLRRWTGPGCALLAVVKSFAYGSDAVRVSELLQDLGADYLVVAYADEAVLLRRRGIRMPILVTSLLPGELGKLVEYELSAVVWSTALLRELDLLGRAAGRPIAVHLKVDTGMGRYGVDLAALPELVALARAAEGVRLEGLMSHLAAADEPSQDDFTRGQIAAFREALAVVEASGPLPPLIHLANSSGALRFKDAHFTAVRPGIALYGAVAPVAGEEAPPLQPAVALHSRLTGVRELPQGRSVGYGRTWATERPTRIGLVGLGYNDGLPRAVSNRGAVWVRGTRAPIVGNVCMDVTMVDLSGVPDAIEGDDVVVYGAGELGEPTVLEVAEWADTIPYEILCRVAPRVRRIVRMG